MAQPNNRNILISGASGLIGTSLIRFFSERRIPIIRLVRGQVDTPRAVRWEPDALDPAAERSSLENAEAAIHLSGASISAQRWTEEYRREIVETRVRTTRALVGLLKQLNRPPRALLCASAVGIYGDRGDEILTESSEVGKGFVANTCRAWEAAAEYAAEAGIRVVHLRFGVVLSPRGGALFKLLPIFRSGFGGRLGSGGQWMSWIAEDDLVHAVLHALEKASINGPVNVTSPNPITNADFTRTLSHLLHRPAILPVPRFALRAAIGEIADEVLLSSERAIPERLVESGFQFTFPDIDRALRSVL